MRARGLPGDAGGSRPRRPWGIAGLVVVGVLLTGCVATSGEVEPAARSVDDAASVPSPRPTPTPEADPVIGQQTVSGVGPQSEERVPLAVPRGTRTVLIDLACDAETRYGAELGDAMMLGQASLSGDCDGERTLAWPWVSGSSGLLSLWVAPEVGWTASVTYSSDPFPQDPAMVTECEAYSQAYSAVSNADNGFGYYAAFGADEWNERMDAAARSLAALAESSRTILVDEFAAMHTVLAERSPIAGGMTETQEFWAVQNSINETCAWNHSEIVVYAEFGG